MSPTAVVTGAGGFVGGAVSRHLVDAGYQVRGTVRSRAGAGRVPPGAQPVEGDVLASGSLAAAFSGADLVVHSAGRVESCRRDPSPMLRTNVIGTRNVVRAAASAGARRVVITSSAVTIGERSGETGREDTPHRGWFLSAYERSKFEAEAAAFAAGRELGVEVVAVNPASVQGPGRGEGTARLLLAAAAGRLPVAVRTTLSFVDVEDCARGHVLAAERGRPGERYILCGATMSTEEALELVRSIAGGRRRTLLLPATALTRSAGAVEAVFRLAGLGPPICRELAAAVAHGRALDGSRATRELGLEYTPPERTVGRALEWFRETGLLG